MRIIFSTDAPWSWNPSQQHVVTRLVDRLRTRLGDNVWNVLVVWAHLGASASAACACTVRIRGLETMGAWVGAGKTPARATRRAAHKALQSVHPPIHASGFVTTPVPWDVPPALVTRLVAHAERAAKEACLAANLAPSALDLSGAVARLLDTYASQVNAHTNHDTLIKALEIHVRVIAERMVRALVERSRTPAHPHVVAPHARRQRRTSPSALLPSASLRKESPLAMGAALMLAASGVGMGLPCGEPGADS